jgi:hypothetical protein
MRQSLVRFVLGAFLVCLTSSSAFAQAAAVTGSIRGTVTDKDGGVVPGATVELKNNATSVTKTEVTNSTGGYVFAALDPGTYTVTVSLSGFKTFVHSDVRLQAGATPELRAVLEVGALTETVNVKAASELVSTTATAVSSTVSMETISNLPVVTRNAMNFVTFLPGVETPGTGRASTINGLPQSTINVTIDGITTSNLLQSGDGFFSMITPRLDAVQEVTVSGAGAGAESAGGGAVQIKFVTRSGTNQYEGSLYHFFRHPSLNTNYFFNEVNGLDKNRVIVHTYGVRVGGPIVIPGVYDGRGKAFFFSNFEHFYQPTEASRTRTILAPEAQQGVFQYESAAAGRQAINVLALAAANGQISAIDPTIATLLTNIRTATTTTGTVSPIPNTLATLNYFYQADSTNNQLAPTNSVDVNLSSRHRLKGTYYLQRFKSRPDLLNNSEARFPGFANFGNQDSYRTTGSITVRSTLGTGFVNEVLGGWQHSPNDFFGNINAGMFADQGGYALNFPLVTDPFTRTDSAPRNTPNWNIDDNMSWLKGNHSFTFGGSFTQVINTLNNRNAVPTLDIAFNTTLDPAASLFTTANFPGATNGQLGDARSLYALLTGRVNQINGVARLNEAGTEYVYLGNGLRRSKGNGLAAYIQDSWRMKPNFTLNYGVRWEALFPFTTITDNYTVSGINDLCGPSGLGPGVGDRQCNLFNPGVLNSPGQVPTYVPYTPDAAGLHTSWFDFGPNVGAAWRPNVQDGFLRSILGDPDQATVRGVFGMQFNRPRIDAFENRYGANPGLNAPGGATRGTAAGQYPLVQPGETFPVLLSETSRLGPPAFVQTPSYPITASLTAGNDVNVIDPDIQTPYTLSWSLGIQRSLGRDTAVEVRYVGNKNARIWQVENWNNENIFENHFLDEFKLAQANLTANIANGRGATFAYTGVPGTSPLPIYLAYFSGVPAAQAGDTSRYTSTNFTNATFTEDLDAYQPDPRGAAGLLWTNSATFRTNAINAGLPLNHFVLNPLVDDANITRSNSGQGSYYNSLQIDLRRRLAQGLFANVNYAYSRTFNSNQADIHEAPIFLQAANVPHAFKTTFSYEIPVGRGRRFGTDMNSALNAAIGNWEFSGTGRVQWRAFVFRGKMFGMTQAELQDNFKIRYAQSSTGTTQVFIMPQDIIDNTRRAFNTDERSASGFGPDGPPTGRYLAPASSPGCIVLYPGDCGQEEIWVRGPAFVRFDLTFKKRVPLGRKASFDLQFDLLNAFDNINFTQLFNPGGAADIFQVTAAYTDINGTFDPGGRLGQFVWRLNF